MRRRYTTRPRAWTQHVDYEPSDVSSPADMTVFEPERAPYWNGLLDADGNKIYVTDELNAGFLNEEFDE